MIKFAIAGHKPLASTDAADQKAVAEISGGNDTTAVKGSVEQNPNLLSTTSGFIRTDGPTWAHQWESCT